MTLPNAFMIDTNLGGLETLDEIGITTGDPDASYRPFSVADKLGDGTLQGNGFPVVVWHWTALAPKEADYFYETYIGFGLSAPIYIRTRLNRLNDEATDYEWATFSGIINWAEGDEVLDNLHTRDVTIRFTNLVEIPSYP